ncbi:MAG TPA: alpha/beta hydrolase, partial [Stellaceae bacterium]|nr:alpha/beta hydrolase [Stellaceae bacterium]
PVTLIGHSLGGSIATRYAGVFPEAVRRLVTIEGLGPSPQRQAEFAKRTIDMRLADWIAEGRRLAGRHPRRYGSIDEALTRMQAANERLSHEQTLHLTRHAARRNEDGTYGWKFDPYLQFEPPADMTPDDVRLLWSRIACPALLVYGSESWASNPAKDGRAAYFRSGEVALIEGAGHWVHHDRFEAFMAAVEPFLAG